MMQLIIHKNNFSSGIKQTALHIQKSRVLIILYFLVLLNFRAYLRGILSYLIVFPKNGIGKEHNQKQHFSNVKIKNERSKILFN